MIMIMATIIVKKNIGDGDDANDDDVDDENNDEATLEMLLCC